MSKPEFEFPISIYGQVEPFNDVLSKARCRIFYKGANRNGTFITDEFANELISTLHYVPIKGIYVGDDFSDHGRSREEGQIYGIVPERNNFAWEQHLDEDGVERTYACTDVLLFTALYPEASDIVGKGQSMELYEPSLMYHTAILQGQKQIVFEHGSFLGLQVLGDDVEPCFEGASFFSLQESIRDTIQKIKEFTVVSEESEMSKINFKLSDDQKYEAIWSLLNTNYNEEGNWTCEYSICAIYDEYALVVCLENGQYERVAYTKNDDDDSVTLGERTEVYIIDVTAKEKDTIETLRQLNGGNYELVNENLTNAEENAKNCEEYSVKIDEMTQTISTLNTEAEAETEKYAALEGQYNELNTKYSALAEENTSLKNYKQSIETQHKEAVMAEYAEKLPEEVINTYKAKLDEYTVEDLDMHLAYELKKSGLAFEQPKAEYILKDTPKSGVEQILSRYKR